MCGSPDAFGIVDGRHSVSDAATSARMGSSTSASGATVCSMDNREACAAPEVPSTGAAAVEMAGPDGSPDGMDELLAVLLSEGTSEASLQLLLSRVDVTAEISARGYEPLLQWEHLAGRIGMLIVRVLETIEASRMLSYSSWPDAR